MATFTLHEFRDHLAEQIGVKGRGNNLGADDGNYIETVISNCQAELEQLNVADWTVETIPDWAAESMVLYCKASISRFGLDPDPAIKALGLIQLRYLEVDTRNDVGKADYF